MRTFIAVVMIGVSAATASAQNATPVCKADQTGDVLVTTVQYQDGYRVDAPWRVTGTRKYTDGSSVTAVLDHIIETDRGTKKRQITELPGAIQMTFKGTNAAQLLRQAADVWCSTVEKALAARASDTVERVAHNRQVM